MKTRVEFRSAAFPKTDTEDSEIVNSSCWGKRLAEFFRDEMPRYGIPTKDILNEDWGWLVYVDYDAFPLWIGCGCMVDEVEESTSEMTDFTALVVAEPSIFKRFFVKSQLAEARQWVVEAIQQLLADHEAIFDVQWID